MILVIRIRGMIDIPGNVRETLHRMRIRRKYSAVLMEDNENNRKLLRSVRNYVSYGIIGDEMLEKLIRERGVSVDGKKIDAKKIVEGLNKKKIGDLGLKPFFRLHPPRKGIESKKHYGVGKGVLGEHKDIDELVGRML